MDRDSNSSDRLDPLVTQLLAIRLVLLIIPVYLFSFSPSCGIFSPSIGMNDFLSRVAFVAVIPGIGFAIIGVFKQSDYALILSGTIATFVIILNGGVQPHFTVLDFILLLLFLELSTTLASLSRMAKPLLLGTDENTSYHYRLVLTQYGKRLMITAAITTLVSIGSLLFVLTYATQIGTLGIASLAIAALILVFIVIALKYSGR